MHDEHWLVPELVQVSTVAQLAIWEHVVQDVAPAAEYLPEAQDGQESLVPSTRYRMALHVAHCEFEDEEQVSVLAHPVI